MITLVDGRVVYLPHPPGMVQFRDPIDAEFVEVGDPWRPRPPRWRGELNELLCARVPLPRFSYGYAYLQHLKCVEITVYDRPWTDKVSRLTELIWWIKQDNEVRRRSTAPRPARRTRHLTHHRTTSRSTTHVRAR